MQYWTAFLLGLFGSLHCAGMCGPLALALSNSGGDRLRFLFGRMAYNTGRLMTYCGLGLVSGLAGHALLLAGVQRWLSIGLGIALILGLVTSRRLGLSRPVLKLVEQLKSGMSRLFRRRSATSLFLLGLMNGLLPCGLVYVACAGAAVTGSSYTAAGYMVAFSMGTFPMMLAIGLSGRLVPPALRLRLVKAVPVAVLCLAALLILRGLSLGIPYLSPDLSGTGPSCCQR